MIGSGVVAKAALSLGRNAIGVDIDPLAIIQGRSLCASISTSRFDSVAEMLIKAAAKALRSKRIIEAQWREKCQRFAIS
jgi:hypothetical protein